MYPTVEDRADRMYEDAFYAEMDNVHIGPRAVLSVVREIEDRARGADPDDRDGVADAYPDEVEPAAASPRLPYVQWTPALERACRTGDGSGLLPVEKRAWHRLMLMQH